MDLKSCSLTASVDLSWLHSPLCSIPMDMRHLSGPNFINNIQTSPPPISSWVQARLSLIFTFRIELLCHLGHLCVPTSEHANMIWESHYSQMAGHFGMEKTMVILQKHFYWPKLRQDVNKYIRSCTSCAISKPAIKKQGLYTPLPTPEKPWESISMDYMSGLPSTKKGNDCVFVVVDRFSKMAILTACKKNITVTDTAKLFFE
jgi:hypothetical protein